MHSWQSHKNGAWQNRCRDPDGVLAAARAVHALRTTRVADGAKRRKAAADERRTHRSAELEAWVREFAAVQVWVSQRRGCLGQCSPQGQCCHMPQLTTCVLVDCCWMAKACIQQQAETCDMCLSHASCDPQLYTCFV